MIAPAKQAVSARPETVPCDHCGLPSPPADNGPSFCCDGCRGAYALIHEWDLEDYYALRDQLGGRASKPRTEHEAIDLLDNVEVVGAHRRDLGDGNIAVELAVEGVHCGACAWLIERTVPLVSGWESARVNLTKRSVEVVYKPERTKLSSIARTLTTFGYRLRPLPDGNQQRDPERPARLRNIAIAGFCFANAMWIAIALYAGADGLHGRYLTAFGTLLAVIAVFGPGQTFLRSAWASFRTRTPHIDLPVSVGLLAGLGGSIAHLITGQGESYLDSICGLVFFLLLGRELQAVGQHRANAAVQALASLRPPLANRVLNTGETTVVRASDVVPGDVVEVRAGETIPVDGIIREGRSLLDQSILTGESVPVEVGPESHVAAGVTNLERVVRVQAIATGNQTRVAAISRLVEQSLSNRTPLVQLADRIGAYFVIAILLLAVIVFGVGMSASTAFTAGQRAVALLVVACPCALALATPLAIGVAVGRAAKRGILIRRGDVFERLQHIGTVWFDKTGTLTLGSPKLIEWHGDNHTLALAAAVEFDSHHPIARCLIAAANDRDLHVAVPTDVAHARCGVHGQVNGSHVIVGTQRFLAENGIELGAAQQIQASRFADEGLAPGFVAVNGAIAAVFAIGDEVRHEAASVIRRLRDDGWDVGILSGDPQ